MNLYKIIKDLLNELVELYDDSDKETNFQRKYAYLTQELDKFNEFYSYFQQLFFYLNYHKKQLIVNLQDKIILHLHAV